MTYSMDTSQAGRPGDEPAPAMELATPGSRLVAFILDIVVQLVFVLLLAGAALILGAIFFPLSAIPALGIIAVTIGYFPYFWARSGQTPGMAAMKIKVVRQADGGALTAGSSILRFIGLYIGIQVIWIGVLWILVDKQRRGWQDLFAGTIVVALPPPAYTS
jgi:uncharacterized RDD family membrane protein YckC